MSNNSVSVVIPAYNSSKTIAKAIEGVLSQTILPLEIILVDDGSKDTTASIIKKYPQVKYIFQENAGPAKARNTGAFNASADIIFFTDSDCVPQKDWIEKSLIHFSDKSVGAVCGSYGIVNDENILARCIYKEIMFRHHHLMPKYPKAFGSYNVAVRKNIFAEVKGFNGRYRTASGEDNDLSYKILKLGSKIYFEKDSIVRHHFPEKLKKYLKEQHCHGFWRVQTYTDHPEMVTGDDYTYWKDMVEVLGVFLIGLLILCAFINSAFIFFILVSIGLLFLIEIFSTLYITKDFKEQLFYSFVMFARSFVRTCGLIKGLFYFLAKKILKIS